MIRRIGLMLLLAFAITLSSVGAAQDEFDVALFFPGELGGVNPIEPPIREGMERVADSFDNVSLRLVEGGPASDWESTTMALVAAERYELIITVTDGMPQIIENINALFPEQQYVLLDSPAPGSENVYSVIYSDEELGFLAGVVAGLLVTHEETSRSLDSPAVGLLAGTSYPQMDERIRPGFVAGLSHVAPEAQALYAVVGDWNNPNRARDLALNMFGRGATALLAVTGGGDAGIHRAAAESDGYVIAVNTNQNALQPGVIVASVLKRLDNSIYSVVEQLVAGELPFGTVATAGIAEGAISVAQDEEHVPTEVLDRVADVEQAVRTGEIDVNALVSSEEN